MPTTVPRNMRVSLACPARRPSLVYRLPPRGRPTWSHSHQPVPVPCLVVHAQRPRGNQEVRHRAGSLTGLPDVAPRGVQLVGLDDVRGEVVADLERRPVPAPHPPVAVSPRVVA